MFDQATADDSGDVFFYSRCRLQAEWAYHINEMFVNV